MSGLVGRDVGPSIYRPVSNQDGGHCNIPEMHATMAAIMVNDALGLNAVLRSQFNTKLRRYPP